MAALDLTTLFGVILVENCLLFGGKLFGNSTVAVQFVQPDGGPERQGLYGIGFCRLRMHTIRHAGGEACCLMCILSECFGPCAHCHTNIHLGRNVPMVFVCGTGLPLACGRSDVTRRSRILPSRTRPRLVPTE